MSNSNLLPELIADILPHLPVKSLSRFKCISKPWRTHISHPDFIKTHLHLAQFRRILLSSANSLYSIDHETDDLTTAVVLHYPRDQTQNPKPQSHAVQIIGSCNGLVCIMTQPDIFFIFNPTTHQSTRLPYVSIGFGGLSAAIGYGFGYAASIDDYKLVKAAPSLEIGVFSLRGGDWHMRNGFLYQDPENPKFVPWRRLDVLWLFYYEMEDCNYCLVDEKAREADWVCERERGGEGDGFRIGSVRKKQ